MGLDFFLSYTLCILSVTVVSFNSELLDSSVFLDVLIKSPFWDGNDDLFAGSGLPYHST